MKSGEKSSKKEATIEEPTDVTGGFGLTMQCSILNRDVPDASSSEIGCIVSNDDGTKYTGSMTDLKASITAKGRTSSIEASPIMSDASSTISIGVNVPGLLPGDALSIAIDGFFDKKPAILTATLKGRFALICDDDFSLYVQVNSPASNLACTKEAPCAKINQAVALLPDIFNCQVTVYMAPDKYGNKTFKEQIVVQGKQPTRNGGLKFIGTDSSFNLPPAQPIVDTDPILHNGYTDNPTPAARFVSPTITIEPPDDLSPIYDPLSSIAGIGKVGRAAILIKSFGIQGAVVSLANMEINGKGDYKASVNYSGLFEIGILIESSRVAIQNFRISNMGNSAVTAQKSSDVQLTDLAIHNSNRGIYVLDTESYVQGSISILAEKDSNNQTKLIPDKPADMPHSMGLELERSNFRFKIGTNFKVQNMNYGIQANNSSTVSVSRIAWITLEGNLTGLMATNNSIFRWGNDPENNGQAEPALTIKNCSLDCISSVKYSTFWITNKPEDTKKLKINLESSSASANLIKSSNNSYTILEHAQNQWCGANPYAVKALSGGYFSVTGKSGDQVFKQGCNPTQKFANIGVRTNRVQNQSCPAGAVASADGLFCDSDFGTGLWGTQATNDADVILQRLDQEQDLKTLSF
jgi:hypothetical protein